MSNTLCMCVCVMDTDGKRSFLNIEFARNVKLLKTIIMTLHDFLVRFILKIGTLYIQIPHSTNHIRIALYEDIVDNQGT